MSQSAAHVEIRPIELSDEIAFALDTASDEGHPVAIAYVDDNGRPHLSLRGTVQVFDDDCLALWARSPGLPNAVATNPHVALLYHDLASHTMYQFSGRARVAQDEHVRTRVFEHSPAREQAFDEPRRGSAVLIDVDSVQGIGPSGPLRMAR